MAEDGTTQNIRSNKTMFFLYIAASFVISIWYSEIFDFVGSVIKWYYFSKYTNYRTMALTVLMKAVQLILFISILILLVFTVVKFGQLTFRAARYFLASIIEMKAKHKSAHTSPLDPPFPSPDEAQSSDSFLPKFSPFLQYGRLLFFAFSVVLIEIVLVFSSLDYMPSIFISFVSIVLTSGAVGYAFAYTGRIHSSSGVFSPDAFLAMTTPLAVTLSIGLYGYASQSNVMILSFLCAILTYATVRAKQFGVFGEKNPYGYFISIGIYVWTLGLVSFYLESVIFSYRVPSKYGSYITMTATARYAVTLTFALLVIGQAAYNIFSLTSGKTDRKAETIGGDEIWDLWKNLIHLPIHFIESAKFFGLFTVSVVVEIRYLLQRYLFNWRLIGSMTFDLITILTIFIFLGINYYASNIIITYLSGVISLGGIACLVTIHVVNFLFSLWMAFYFRLSEGRARIPMYLFGVAFSEVVAAVMLTIACRLLVSTSIGNTFKILELIPRTYFGILSIPITDLIVVVLIGSSIFSVIIGYVKRSDSGKEDSP